MKIRKASLKDFEELYLLGINTPELNTTKDGVFMQKNEFKDCIQKKHGVFLLAEENNKIVGFIYASIGDIDRHFNNWACLIYATVLPNYRRKGIASKLYKECINLLKKRGVSKVYGLANSKSNAIIKFLQKQKFEKGKEFIWMQKDI